jgi:hypothetical protein
MSFYGYSDNGNRNAQLGIYDTSSPSNHIDHTGSITVSYNSGSPGWLTGSTVGSAAVSSSQYYLCFNSDNTTVAIAYTTGGSNNFKLKSSVNYGTWPSTITWSSGSYKRIFSVYATYTAGGGDAVQSTGSMSTNTGYWGA